DGGPGVDGGPGLDGGGSEDGGAPMPGAVCAERTAAIVDATGATIRVRPAGDGQVEVDGETRTLRQVVSGAAEGTTILLEDGTYTLPEASGGSYTGLYFTTPNVTLRSASGDASAVVIDSAYRSHGGSTAPITVDAPGVVLASFTVRRSIFHLIHLWKDADGVVIHDVDLIDGGQQFLKSSPGDGLNVDDVEVSCSRFRMTDAGRDNVWGYGSPDGNTTCYTGGIDTHDARDWHVHDSVFEGIYCDADGTPRPAHGQAADQRGGMTYTGGLAEHAIHMWDSEEGSGHRIERNHIVDCARGIGLGLRAEVYGTTIRNNMVFSRFPRSGEHDVGIIVERAHESAVVNNTVFFASPDAYPNAIEYRWGSTSGLRVLNNLTNGRIRARNDATATLGGNVEAAEASWFVDGAEGDLHLARCDIAEVDGAGESVAGLDDDFDGEAREGAIDVGADQCTSAR
ncbi:MAG TPA: hypothetical protein RMI62_31100, partial [Polyangiaceae bacterium LLY-WYZ-15_(1-7)]|nr:hypothetical protein [Polyangiaceae bacterium LLY-WYZ-15_(1-7)]